MGNYNYCNSFTLHPLFTDVNNDLPSEGPKRSKGSLLMV